ncbi:MAG: TolC family outer membrane protein [Burkholderiales bacterium]|nr:TolC family outer membrane protein [Burkholderiales bacterium]
MTLPLPKPLPLRAITVAALLALGALSQQAHAQSLKALVDAARGYDASFQGAKASADAARYRIQQAEAGRNPSAALGGEASFTNTDPPQVGPKNATNLGVNLTGKYPLYNRSTGAIVDQATRGYEVAQADLALVEQDLIVRVAQAYFDVLGAQDALTAASANKKAIAEQLASAKRNFEVGTATITDTREAQARFDLATAQEIAADNDLRSKRIVLDQVVGQTGAVPRGLQLPVNLPNLAPDTPDTWVSRSDEGPSVRKARLALEIARLESEKSRAASSPTLDAVGRLGGNYASGSAVTASGGSDGLTRTASIGLQFSMPLYTGGAVENRLKETIALEVKSRNDLDFARRAVAQQTRQIWFGVQSGQAGVKALEAAESSSKLALEATQLGYKVGVRVNLDVLNAQTQLFSTQRDLAKARYDVMVNGLRLRQAAGVLSADDVDEVNKLLVR